MGDTELACSDRRIFGNLSRKGMGGINEYINLLLF
jgi:hypothetical protein